MNVDSWGYSHLKLTFKNPNERKGWWLGRLIKIRKKLNELLIQGIPEDEIGIVISFYYSETSDSYVRVSFPEFGETWVKTTNVKTQEEK